MRRSGACVSSPPGGARWLPRVPAALVPPALLGLLLALPVAAQETGEEGRRDRAGEQQGEGEAPRSGRAQEEDAERAPEADEEVRDREVVSLEFRGNEAFSAGELGTAIATRETKCRSILFKFPFPICPLTDWGFAHDRAYLDEEELPRDVLRLRVFYRQRGYRDVGIDTLVNRLDGEAEVRFLIDEGSPVLLDSLRLEGLEGVADPERIRQRIEEDIDLEPGVPFDRIKLDRAKDLIRTRLRGRGYVNADVLEETFLPQGEGARVTLQVVPGDRVRIGDIRIQGAETIDERVIRRFLTFRSGEYFDQEEILRSQRQLYGLDALRFASVERAGELEPGDTLVDVTVLVTEAPMRTIRSGGGVSTTECVVSETRFTHRNFLGGARRLELSGRLGNIFAMQLGRSFPCVDVGDEDVFRDLTFRIRTEVRQPYFFSSRNSFRGAVFFERESVPDIFVRQTAGAEVAVTRRIRLNMPAILSYRPEYTGFDEMSADIFFCVNFGFCQPEDIGLLEERRLLSPLALSWSYDRTDHPLSPTRGYKASAEVELADRFTASAWQYVRFVLEAADFEALGEELVFAARARAGIVEPIGGLAFDDQPTVAQAGALVHPRKRFFAGGARSVRGFRQNLLGPTVLVVDSTEHCADQALPACVERLAREDPRSFDERPTGGDASAELTVELRKGLGGPWGVAGFVDMGQVWRDLSELEAPVATPGFGIRYSSPVGPIRLDIAYNPEGAELLPVVAQVGEEGEIRELDTEVLFDPFTFDDPGLFKEVLRRLQLQLSVGEAF